MFEAKLLNDVYNGGQIYWAGQRPPTVNLTVSQSLFDAEGDFRLSPTEHGGYSTVYLVEYDIGLYKQWPLILDEALRLFEYEKTGTLFVRFSQTDLLSAFSFAAFLRRRKDFFFELVYQDEFSNGVIAYCLRCRREAAAPALSSIEFALITDGHRPEAVARFVDSVAAIRGIDFIDWKIAICGPAEFCHKLATNSNNRIRYVDAPLQHEDKGWITRKKNMLVGTSLADNMLIAHDRYEVTPAFLEQLFEFGADFDVVVPAQLDAFGGRFPDWVATGSQWSRTRSGMLEHGDYSPHGYVNGGVIIGKRHIFSDAPWSELLFWGQYEDVELSRALTSIGVTPRFARSVVLRAVTARPNYLKDFTRLPYLSSSYPLPRDGAYRSETVVGLFPIGETFNLNGTNPRKLIDAGLVVASADWICGGAGLVLLRREAEIALSLEPRGTRSLFLNVYLPAYSKAPLIQLAANGTPLQVRWTDSADGTRCGTATLDGGLDPSSRSLTLSLVTDTAGILLTALGIAAQDTGGSPFPLAFARVDGVTAGIFREGWGAPESWGIWSIGDVAHLQLPITNLPSTRDIELSIVASAYGPSVGFMQMVGIACNGIPLTCVAIAARGAPAHFSVRIPRALIHAVPTIRVSFLPAFPTPSEEAHSADFRRLGFGLIGLDARAG